MMRIISGLIVFLAIAAFAQGADVPKEAIVLFDGKDLSKWVYKADGSPAKWKIMEDGSMQVAGGDIITKDKYTDFKLHVEFWCPNMPADVKGQGRGNSGVYLQGCYEVQILDSYGLKSQKNDCGAIYNQKAPDVNACTPPEQWQTYDITFKAARYDETDGKKIENPRVTVEQNGQVIHKDVEIEGPTGGGDPETSQPGPILLQDHHNTVRFRNVWIIPLDASKEGK